MNCSVPTALLDDIDGYFEALLLGGDAINFGAMTLDAQNAPSPLFVFILDATLYPTYFMPQVVLSYGTSPLCRDHQLRRNAKRALNSTSYAWSDIRCASRSRLVFPQVWRVRNQLGCSP